MLLPILSIYWKDSVHAYLNLLNLNQLQLAIPVVVLPIYFGMRDETYLLTGRLKR